MLRPGDGGRTVVRFLAGGVDPAFGEIGRRHGPFELLLLEIGAFDPAWGTIHLGPENAVRAHALLGGGLLLPIHWATFNLGLHAWYEPPEQLRAAARAAGIPVAWPRPGQTFLAGGPLPAEPWWRAHGGDTTTGVDSAKTSA